MGSTRYVYLDENAGKTAAPFMSQPLEKNFIGEEENVEQEEVECNLALEKMKLLLQRAGRAGCREPRCGIRFAGPFEQGYGNAGEYLARKGEVGEEKALQAARIVFSIQQSNLIDIFTSNAENAKWWTNFWTGIWMKTEIPSRFPERKRKPCGRMAEIYLTMRHLMPSGAI